MNSQSAGFAVSFEFSRDPQKSKASLHSWAFSKDLRSSSRTTPGSSSAKREDMPRELLDKSLTASALRSVARQIFTSKPSSSGVCSASGELRSWSYMYTLNGVSYQRHNIAYFVVRYYLRCFRDEPVGKSSKQLPLVVFQCWIFMYQVAEESFPEVILSLFRE